MAAVAGRAGLPVVLYAAGLLAVAGAAVMSRVPKPPHIATVAPEAQAAASQACSFAPVTFLLRRRPSRYTAQGSASGLLFGLAAP